MSATPMNSKENDAAPVETLSPEPSAGHKRMMDFHVTAFPSRVNEQLLPERALKSTDFSAIDPLQYRKNHAVKNNNVSSTGPGEWREPGLEMMSTSHLATHFMLMGQELSKNSTGNTKALMPRGYFTRYIAPPFDERSTYRQDYCQEEPEGFTNAAKLKLENYRNNWTEEEKANVDISKNIPYLTLPESHCKNRNTMYRYTMMPEAQRNDFRTISQHTNLPDLGTSFAYSAYTDDDPRRTINFDPKIAALKRPKSFLEKTSDDVEYDADKAKATHEELERLRGMRREKLMRKRGSSTGERVEDITGNCEKHLIIPGTKGSGYRRAPKDNTEYVYLPRDHFCHGVVSDW